MSKTTRGDRTLMAGIGANYHVHVPNSLKFMNKKNIKKHLRIAEEPRVRLILYQGTELRVI